MSEFFNEPYFHILFSILNTSLYWLGVVSLIKWVLDKIKQSFEGGKQ